MIRIANRLQMRLFAAVVVFWLAGAALESVWLIQLMGACGFAALAGSTRPRPGWPPRCPGFV
jgi:hypothetical protein